MLKVNLAEAQSDDIHFVELMRAGHVAYAAGRRRKAHYLWRRAAVLRPYDEQVWLALLNVVDNDEDRRVCLQNVVAINPANLEAQYQLRGYEGAETQPMSIHRVQELVGGRRGGWLRRIVWFLEGALLGILLAVALSILLHYFF